MSKRNSQRIRRHKRIRSKISGSPERPRVSVYRSHNHLYAQLIDDNAEKTLLGISDTAIDAKGTKSERAALLGELFASKAKELKVSRVVFDRGGHVFIGRVKSFAEAARKSGLEF